MRRVLLALTTVVLFSGPAVNRARAYPTARPLVPPSVVFQQLADQPARDGAPVWKGSRKKGTERPVTQTIITVFSLIGVLYTIARTARRAYGD